MSFHKMIHRLIKIPIKTKSTPFSGIDKLSLKFIWKCKGLAISKTIVKKKKDARGLSLFDFNTYYKNLSPQDTVVLS